MTHALDVLLQKKFAHILQDAALGGPTALQGLRRGLTPLRGGGGGGAPCANPRVVPLWTALAIAALAAVGALAAAGAAWGPRRRGEAEVDALQEE